MNKQNATTEALNNEQDYAPENPEWGKVRLIMRDDTVGGGLNGNLNKPIIDLAKRMAYIKKQNEDITEQAKTGFILLSSFEDGAKLTLANEVLLYKSDGQYYRWTGDLPKIIVANSTPESSGGIGGGRWVLVGDSSLRSELSGSDGSARIGYKGSTVQAELDSNGLLDYYISQMAAGQTVKIACYGDSTTDGNTTTGWIRNVAGSNHNDNAPNAWPIQLQNILREMYKNKNIFVFNAGFSGQRLDNGWATNNYEKLIVNNQFYGKCDIVFIGFGINDASSNNTNVLNDTLIQTNLLIDKIKKSGALPILLTCNVVRSRLTGHGDNKLLKIERLNNLKKYIAKMRNIPIFDLDTAMKNWMQKNTDKYNYADLQPDKTHWGDLGHQYQASWLANILFNNIVKIDSNNTYESIYFLDPRSNSPIGSDAMSTTTNAKFGVNPFVLSSKFDCRNQILMDIWVWCEHVDASIIYRMLLNDANDSIIKITDILTGNIIKTTPGFLSFQFNDYSTVDAPHYIGQLKYGLNRIQLVGDNNIVTGVLFGHFDFVANYQAKLVNKNILQNTGIFRDYKTLIAPIAEPKRIVSFQFSPDIYDNYGTNVIQLFNKDKITNIYLEGMFANGTGIFLVQANGRRKNTINGIILFGFGATVSIYVHRYNTETKESNYTQIGDSVAVSADSDGKHCIKLRAYFNQNGYATIDFYQNESQIKTISWEGVTNSIPPISGVAGNIYRYCGAGLTQEMNVELSRFEVWYTDR
ncbi:hypothetical protein J3U57_06275 [Gilliamella sp. B3464]|nr:MULTISPECIES: GDSL-type esterase/lipase family protein [unclassified Gilliamella]MCX8712281.1 hypothetical protein [Gilliamella sp. B3468]MCX8751173.1 hypothetical protein [Gilliamella sp. B3464]